MSLGCGLSPSGVTCVTPVSHLAGPLILLGETTCLILNLGGWGKVSPTPFGSGSEMPYICGGVPSTTLGYFWSMREHRTPGWVRQGVFLHTAVCLVCTVQHIQKSPGKGSRQTKFTAGVKLCRVEIFCNTSHFYIIPEVCVTGCCVRKDTGITEF